MIIPSVQSFRFDFGDPGTPAGDHLSLFPLRQLEKVGQHLWLTGSKCGKPYGRCFVFKSVIRLDFHTLIWP